MAMDRWRGYVPLRDAIDQLFAGSFITPQTLSPSSFPMVDMYTTENDVVIDMAVPGLNPDDINIQVTGDTVTVSGEVKGSRRGEKGQPFFEEIWRGNFQRSFTLPIEVDADKANATCENGILKLTLPKSEATRPRKVQVRPGQQTITQTAGAGEGKTERETVPVKG